MTRGPLRSSAGFTYIAALVMVVITGIMLSQGALVWSTRMQREREEEFIFRGRQVRDALRRRYGLTLNTYGAFVAPGGTPPVTPLVTAIPPTAPKINELKDLVQATDSAGSAHYLRPAYLTVNDPITGKKLDWELFKDLGTGRITGVYIKNDHEPIKQGKFPADLDPADFEGKKKYSDWVFICTKYPKPVPPGGVQNLPGATNVPPVSPGGSPATK